MIKTYRKKPIKIRALRFEHDNFDAILAFTNNTAKDFTIAGDSNLATCIIPTLEGDHKAIEGDYIIEGVKGEFYPCKSDIFWQTYEELPVDETILERLTSLKKEFSELAEQVG